MQRERLQNYVNNGEKAVPTFSDHEMNRRLEAIRGHMSKAGRGGSVDLNRFRAFSKWFSASVMPPPLRVSAD